MKRGGFSLLEVILALAILGGGLAVLGELARLGLRNAQIARETAQAQLLCESKLAEITAGITPLQGVSGVEFEEPLGNGTMKWLYSIDVQQTDCEGMSAVRVTVVQDLPEEKRPVDFSLVRWMQDDPEVEAAESTETEGVGP